MKISAQGLLHNLNSFAWNALEEYKLQDYEWDTLKGVLETLSIDKNTEEPAYEVYQKLNNVDWNVNGQYRIIKEDWLSFKDCLKFYIKNTKGDFNETAKETNEGSEGTT